MTPLNTACQAPLSFTLSWSFIEFFPGGSEGKESAWNAGDPCLIPGLGRSLGEEQSGRWQSKGSQWVCHNWKTNTFTFMFIELVILSDDLILSHFLLLLIKFGEVGQWVVVIVVFYSLKIFVLYRGSGPCYLLC